eukprot:scaffold1166_cov261-Pinguiococcus_pyrenoidosus.AAC.24
MAGYQLIEKGGLALHWAVSPETCSWPCERANEVAPKKRGPPSYQSRASSMRSHQERGSQLGKSVLLGRETSPGFLQRKGVEPMRPRILNFILNCVRAQSSAA